MPRHTFLALGLVLVSTATSPAAGTPAEDQRVVQLRGEAVALRSIEPAAGALL